MASVMLAVEINIGYSFYTSGLIKRIKRIENVEFGYNVDFRRASFKVRYMYGTYLFLTNYGRSHNYVVPIIG